MKVIGIIPARFSSSRFQGKPLALICGKPMIQWVYEQVKQVEEIGEVYVATDDNRILEAVSFFGGKAVLTGECSCGTERVYMASRSIDADIIINVQGDEPLIHPDVIQQLIAAFSDKNVQMATLKKKIEDKRELDDPNIVKVVTDNKGNALFFSRYSIPFVRDPGEDIVFHYKHIGIYGYRKGFLKKFISMPQTNLERSESLEQLRVLENGYKIKVIETEYQSIGVDVPQDIKLVEKMIRGEIG